MTGLAIKGIPLLPCAPVRQGQGGSRPRCPRGAGAPAPGKSCHKNTSTRRW